MLPSGDVLSVERGPVDSSRMGCVSSWEARVAAIQKKLKKGLARMWGLVYSNQAAEARGVSSVG